MRVRLVTEHKVYVQRIAQTGCTSCNQQCSVSVTAYVLNRGSMLGVDRQLIGWDVKLDDRLVMGFAESNLVQASVHTYLAPLAVFFIGAIIGSATSSFKLLNNDLNSAIGGAVGLIVFLLLNRQFEGFFSKKITQAEFKHLP